MFYTIYKTTNTINNKIYIGKHITTNLDDDYLGSGKLLKKAIKKYGKEHFKKEILFVFDTEHEMNLKEIELLTPEYCSLDTNYNIALGGQGGCIALYKENPNYQTIIDKLSATQTKASAAISERVKQLHKERKVGMYGKKHSEETKKRMSDANPRKGKGKPKPPPRPKVGSVNGRAKLYVVKKEGSLLGISFGALETLAQQLKVNFCTLIKAAKTQTPLFSSLSGKTKAIKNGAENLIGASVYSLDNVKFSMVTKQKHLYVFKHLTYPQGY